MEFFNTLSRCNGSSPSMDKKVELSINFYDVISSKEAHPIVCNARNVTKSLHTITDLPSNFTALWYENKLPRCILLSHGLRPVDDGSSKSDDDFEHSRRFLPLTRCTKHENASFLPLDCAAKLPEYTRTTRVVPAVKVAHFFYDCILQFPSPPPISSSEEQLFRRNDYVNKCYQCAVDLSFPKSVYMYRDYLFCSQNCRYRACVTHYWYKKVMNIRDDDEEEAEEKKSETIPVKNPKTEGGVVFFIEF